MFYNNLWPHLSVYLMCLKYHKGEICSSVLYIWQALKKRIHLKKWINIFCQEFLVSHKSCSFPQNISTINTVTKNSFTSQKVEYKKHYLQYTFTLFFFSNWVIHNAIWTAWVGLLLSRFKCSVIWPLRFRKSGFNNNQNISRATKFMKLLLKIFSHVLVLQTMNRFADAPSIVVTHSWQLIKA